MDKEAVRDILQGAQKVKRGHHRIGDRPDKVKPMTSSIRRGGKVDDDPR
jgi:hypothetical protein